MVSLETRCYLYSSQHMLQLVSLNQMQCLSRYSVMTGVRWFYEVSCTTRKRLIYNMRKTLLQDSAALWQTLHLPRNLFSGTLDSVFLYAILKY